MINCQKTGVGRASRPSGLWTEGRRDGPQCPGLRQLQQTHLRVMLVVLLQHLQAELCQSQQLVQASVWAGVGGSWTDNRCVLVSSEPAPLMVPLI